MSRTIQWTQPRGVGVVDEEDERAGAVRGAGPGELGRSVLAAHVKRFGIEPPGSNAVEVRAKSDIVASGVGDWAAEGEIVAEGRSEADDGSPAGNDDWLATVGGLGDVDRAAGAVADAPGPVEHAATATSATSAGTAISRWVAEPRMRRSSTLDRNRAARAPIGRRPRLTALVKRGRSSRARRPPAATPRSPARRADAPNACHRRTTWKPRPSYSWSAPVGFDASTPSHASSIPWSRRSANEAAHSALATPLPRHRRRTETWSSQPRLIPSCAFSSA